MDMENLEDIEMLKEAKDIKKDIFILMWEMNGVLRANPKISYHLRDDVKKMLKQLNEDYVFIEKLINKLKHEIDTV